ncbi:MAG: ATP-binding protein [Pseudomonadota bacterium]
MTFDLSEFLETNRDSIIDVWVEKLHSDVSQRYSERPAHELRGTISDAVEANYQALVHGNYDPINTFIDRITDMRLKAGFLLSDVQKAFELYRIIVMDNLSHMVPEMEFHVAARKLNRCLAYTLHRFSDHFQDMHQQKILRQNRELEQMVSIRTAALEESEQKYKTLVEEINDGYVVIQDGVIVFANQAFCRMHDIPQDAVLGKPFLFFVDPADQDLVRGIHAFDTGAPLADTGIEYRRRTLSGESFPTEIQGKTTRYDNRLSGIGICRDITERVKMEKKVRDTERMAYIGEITASLSHEIRNPLSAIKMSLQILGQNPDIHGNDKRRIDISFNEVIRLERILSQLLDFAKPLQLTMNDHDVRDILNSYIELLDMKFREKDIEVETGFDPKMPVVLVDGEALGQAVINILINAIESSPRSGKIRVTCERPSDLSGGYVRIRITDQGPGFDQTRGDELFKPFFTTKTKGVGLGLANVKRIVDAHKGFVVAEQEHPVGSSFSILIPVRGR